MRYLKTSSISNSRPSYSTFSPFCGNRPSNMRIKPPIVSHRSVGIWVSNAVLNSEINTRASMRHSPLPSSSIRGVSRLRFAAISPTIFSKISTNSTIPIQLPCSLTTIAAGISACRSSLNKSIADFRAGTIVRILHKW